MRRSVLLIALMVMVLISGAVGIAWKANGRPSPLCKVLEARVTGLDSFGWDNGITRSAASWGQVLTDGVSRASDVDRSRLARAVANDQSGFEVLLDAIPESSRPAAKRLHDLAIDPDSVAAERPSDQVDKDVAEIARLGRDECGFA